MINPESVWRMRVIVSMAFVLLLKPSRAYAYVDPGLGGQLFQAVYLIAIGVIGFVVAPLLLFVRTITRAVCRIIRRSDPQVSPVPPDVPPAGEGDDA